MVSSSSIQEQLDRLKQENVALKRRVSLLERAREPEQAPEKQTSEKKPASKSKKAETFETAVGVSWFSKIGILALVVGIGFFIKYAFDNNWISLKLRIILGIILGIALIVAGLFFSKNEKYVLWGHTVTGGGFAVVYFTIYAAYHFEQYRFATGITQMVDIWLLAIVALLAIFVSIKNNSQTIAAEAFFLGFVTSFLSRNFEFITLMYGLILTLAIVFVVSYKNWNSLGIGGVIVTYGSFFMWTVRDVYSFPLSIMFLLSYFLTYTYLSFKLEIGADKNSKHEGLFIFLINSAAFFLISLKVLHEYFPDSIYLFAFFLSIFYCIAYYLSWRFEAVSLSQPVLYLAITHFTLAAVLKLSQEWITVFFACEAVILAIVALKFESEQLKKASYAITILLLAKTVFIDSWAHQFDFSALFESTRVISYVAAILACYFIAYVSNVQKPGQNKEFDIYAVAASFLLFLLILFEMKRFWISIGWALLAICSLLAGFYLKKASLRLTGIIIFSIAVFKVFLLDTSALGTLYRTISFIILGILLLFASFVYARHKDKLKELL